VLERDVSDCLGVLERVSAELLNALKEDDNSTKFEVDSTNLKKEIDDLVLLIIKYRRSYF
jgi:hypothetical protein